MKRELQNKILCGIIGLGRIGSSLEDDVKREKPASHAGCIKAHPKTVLTCGADIDSHKRTAFQKRWQVNNVYEDSTQMLAQESLHIVHIATPPSTHLTILSQCIKAKIPVIILEKPIASSIKEAKKIVKLANNYSGNIVVNHERRFARPYVEAAQITQNKKYGDLLSIHAKLMVNSNAHLKELLYDDGTHMLDVIQFLCNDELRVKKSFQKLQQKEMLIIYLETKQTQIVLEVSTMQNHFIFELDLHYASGRIRIGNGLYEEYESTESPYYKGFNSLVNTGKSFKKSEYFIEMFRDAVRRVDTANLKPRSSVHDGYLALCTIEKITDT